MTTTRWSIISIDSDGWHYSRWCTYFHCTGPIYIKENSSNWSSQTEIRPDRWLWLGRKTGVGIPRSMEFRVAGRSMMGVSIRDGWLLATVVDNGRLAGVSIRRGDVARSHVSPLSLLRLDEEGYEESLDCLRKLCTCCCCCRSFSCLCQTLYGQ